MTPHYNLADTLVTNFKRYLRIKENRKGKNMKLLQIL